MDNEKQAFYSDLADKYESQIDGIQKKISSIGTLRLLCVILTGLFLYIFHVSGIAVIAGIGLVGIVLFCSLCLLHKRLFDKRDYYKSAIAVCRKELQLFQYNFSGIDPGNRHRNIAHDYTGDLDIFGEKSLYSYLNRSASMIGDIRFAELLKNPYTEVEMIKKRQEATSEISDKPELRIHFQALGGIRKEKASDKNDIQKLARMSLSLSPIISAIVQVLPFFWVIAGIAVWFDLMNGSWLLLPFLACASFAFIRNKSISQLQAQLSTGVASLKAYARLFQVVEQERFNSAGLVEISEKLSVSGEKVSNRIKHISSILSDLDQRCNAVAFLLLNGLLLWDFRQLVRIIGWQRLNASQLISWIDALAEFDVYCTLGTFRYNHPDYSFPILNGSDFPTLNAEEMGHPLIHPGICVRNGVELLGRPSFIIVTGANMAGKSTYLRTIGVNFLLAMIGAPVCAKSMEISPCTLYTSLRTTDSLIDNESYFFAELKRLQQMVERLQQGEKMFIILDEILKGTNSVDKQRGSLALVERLIKLKAVGIIATHDLQLGVLADRYPKHIRNFRFEAEIIQDNLFFPYKMQQGIAENMNAYFLMEKMGIIAK